MAALKLFFIFREIAASGRSVRKLYHTPIQVVRQHAEKACSILVVVF